MVGIRVVIASIFASWLTACGSKGPPVTTPEPEHKIEQKKPEPPPETEEDRAQRRHTVALTLVPESSSCLPLALKEPSAPRLDLAAVGIDAVVCAVDTDPSRLLGPVGCWKVDLKSGALAYYPPAPLPNRGFDALFDDNCVRGYCLPKTATVPANKIAHLVWNLDGKQVAVLAGDDVHIFDAAAKTHLSTFSVRGDKGITNEPFAIHWVGDTLLVEGSEGPFSGVWVYKLDGTPVGPIEPIGSKDGKPISTFGGSLSILDDKRVALAEQGFSALTVYEVGTSRRTRQVRKVPKAPCKPDEVDAYWKNSEVASPKCKDALIKNFSSLIGAEAVAGKTSLLVMMRGSRLGDLAVLDMQTLAEKKAIKLPWCSAPGN
jgi:predicted small lipoprotein YifL